MKPFLAALLLLTALISCTPRSGCSDCEPIPQQLTVKPIGEGFKIVVGSGVFISIGHSVQWEADLGFSPFPSNQVSWSATRGTISESGLFKAPATPTPPNSVLDLVNAVRKDVSNPKSNDQGGAIVYIVASPSIQSFSSPTPMPVAAGAAVTLTFQFADGSAELDTGSTLVQSGLVSGANVTVNPTTTAIYTLKVTNQAGDSVSRDLIVSVQ